MSSATYYDLHGDTVLVQPTRPWTPQKFTPPELVVERTDDYVDTPFRAVGLYWLKQYLPLVLHQRLCQHREDAGALHRLSGNGAS